MPSPIQASIGIELTLNLTATYQPGMRAPTRRGEPPTEPDDPECVEDTAIDAVLYETYERDASSPSGFRSRTVDILRGVDTTNPHVILLLDNLLTCVNDAAEEALLAEVGDGE